MDEVEEVIKIDKKAEVCVGDEDGREDAVNLAEYTGDPNGSRSGGYTVDEECDEVPWPL